jgi:hypothetical protein
VTKVLVVQLPALAQLVNISVLNLFTSPQPRSHFTQAKAVTMRKRCVVCW